MVSFLGGRGRSSIGWSAPFKGRSAAKLAFLDAPFPFPFLWLFEGVQGGGRQTQAWPIAL